MQNLESLRWVLNYYKESGIENIVIQRKEMGSRYSVYLFDDPQKCYGISRRGFRQDLDLTHEYERLIKRFENDFKVGLRLRILDCELLPWRALGGDLIDRSFYGYYELAKQEQSKSDELGFAEAYFKLDNSIDKSCGELNKADFIEKHGHHVYKNFKLFPYVKNEDNSENIEKFKEQVDLYGKEETFSLKPFAILKDVYEDQEIIRITESNFTNWEKINDDPVYMVNVNNNDAYDKAKSIFDSLTFNEGYEGVVIKPEFVKPGVAPYIKVRNSEYLRLVYGFDYLNNDKYNKLCAKKRINNKLKKSIEDFKNGYKLLEVPYNEISEENPTYINTLIKFVLSERQNEKIDPRL